MGHKHPEETKESNTWRGAGGRWWIAIEKGKEEETVEVI